MSRDSSRKKKVSSQQRATGDSYMRARRQMENGGDAAAGEIPPPASEAELLSLLGLGRAGAPDVTELWAQRQLPVGTGALDADETALSRWLLLVSLGPARRGPSLLRKQFGHNHHPARHRGGVVVS